MCNTQCNTQWVCLLKVILQLGFEDWCCQQSDQWTEQNTMYLVSFSCFFLQFEKHVSSLFTKIHIRQFDAIVEIRNSEYCTEKIYRTY